MASFSLDMVLPALMLVALVPLSAAKMIFIPGTGCGTFSPIKIHDNVAENATMEDLACSFVKDEDPVTALKKQEPSWISKPWTECSASCGGGNRTRQRQCKRENDTAVLDPNDCGGGPTLLTTTCNTHKCASWTEWSPLPCPVFCGHLRTNTRRRTSKETPSGSALENFHCELFGESSWQSSGSCGGIKQCPTWAEWSQGTCSCPSGLRTDSTHCIGEKGEAESGCSGSNSRVVECGEECPRWTEWTIGTCSPLCTTGQRTDTRQCIGSQGQATTGCVGDASRLRQCTVVTDGPYGGSGGTVWSDCAYVVNGPITGIQVNSGNGINSVRFRYGSVWAPFRGGIHETTHVTDLWPDPLHIDSVHVRAGGILDYLHFQSGTKNRNHGPYGGSGGSPFHSHRPGCYLHFASGRSAGVLDQISLHYICLQM